TRIPQVPNFVSKDTPTELSQLLRNRIVRAKRPNFSKPVQGKLTHHLRDTYPYASLSELSKAVGLTAKDARRVGNVIEKHSWVHDQEKYIIKIESGRAKPQILFSEALRIEINNHLQGSKFMTRECCWHETYSND